MRKLEQIVAGALIGGIILGTGCDSHQKELKRRWDNSIAKGARPYILEVGGEKIEYLDTNESPGYDLARTDDPKVYAEIGETSLEDLEK